jgi:hypothetical protein
MIVVKLADKEDMIVGFDIGMLALFSRHTSHTFALLHKHAPFLWR